MPQIGKVKWVKEYLTYEEVAGMYPGYCNFNGVLYADEVYEDLDFGRSALVAKFEDLPERVKPAFKGVKHIGFNCDKEVTPPKFYVVEC